MSPSVLQGKAFFPGPEGSAVRPLAVALEGGIVPSHFRHQVRVGAIVPEPGAVEGAGEGVVLAMPIVVSGIADAPFEEEAVDALPVGGVVVAQLEAVVLAVYSAAAIGAVGIPCPETGHVFLLIPETEVPHPLAEGVDGIPVEGIGVVGAVDEGLRAFVDGALQFVRYHSVSFASL